MLGDGVPLPVTAETPARILRTVEKENSYGGRRLSSATISRGGVTVRGKGVLEVLDGGSLEIVTGDLILAAGMIKADMLREHLFPEVYSAPRRYLTSLNVSQENAWSTPQTLITARPPDWAKTAIILSTEVEYLAVDVNFAQAHRSVTATTVNGAIGAPVIMNEQPQRHPSLAGFLGQATGLDFIEIPQDRLVRTGFAHRIAFPKYARPAASWVTEQALIFWM